MTRDVTEWTVHPDAEALVGSLVAEALDRSPRSRALAAHLRTDTSTRLEDWLDHVTAPVQAATLESAGYVDGHHGVGGVWRHPGAQLPAVVPASGYGLALRVDDAAAFAAAQVSGAQSSGAPVSGAPVEGAPGSGFRRAVVSGDEPVALAGVERRSWACGTTPAPADDASLAASVRAKALWAERPRGFDGADGVAATVAVAEQMVGLVGEDLAASYALEVERAFWQRRNTAAVLQHARQDRLGLGWGNNDHHTFRSSREAFRPLVAVFRALGFTAREQFYAGAEAGWGAQVMEHPGCGGVVFADVDLGPDEVDLDFASATLPPSERLGTVGLWCALHGESVLAAGMHHLEGQFEFDLLRDDLTGLGIGHMAPFSDFPHLRQAFTEAERWPVPSARVEPLVTSGQLDRDRALEFLASGAPGSHLENLARRGGFKGFNQTNVSTTMRATDPRVYAGSVPR